MALSCHVALEENARSEPWEPALPSWKGCNSMERARDGRHCVLSFFEHFVPFWNDWCSFVPFVCLLFSVCMSEDRTGEEELPFFGSERMGRISRHLVLAHLTIVFSSHRRSSGE